MRNEMKCAGWFAVAIGAFIVLYGGFSLAGDSSMRGYGVDELKQYYTDVFWMWDAYFYSGTFGLFLIVTGLIIAIPITIQDRKSRAK